MEALDNELRKKGTQEIIASVKTTAAVNKIKELLKENPNAKGTGETWPIPSHITSLDDINHHHIVFCQAMLCLGILGRLLQKEKIGFLYYCGEMTADSREKAIIEFEKNPEAKVLVSHLNLLFPQLNNLTYISNTMSHQLLGVRAGGEALNLTAASYAISLDPWWNNAQDKQAFGRVARFGQTQRVRCYRFMVKGTIDRKIYRMQ